MSSEAFRSAAEATREGWSLPFSRPPGRRAFPASKFPPSTHDEKPVMGENKPVPARPFVAALCLAAVHAAVPLDLHVGEGPGASFVKAAKAAAKDGGSDRGGGGDHGGDSNSGHDSGHDDRDGSSGRGDAKTGDADDRHSGRNGERVEAEENRIQVVYPGGWEERIRDGIFELKDPRGRTVIERRATARDRARLRALAR